MQDRLHKYIADRALFVGGRGAWFRHENDQKVQSAILDVERFISTLPVYIDTPHISGGTTVSPEKIVTLIWPVGGYPTIKGVTISFKGDGKCDAAWDDPNGGTAKIEDASINELLSLDIPQKIVALTHRTPPRFWSTHPR